MRPDERAFEETFENSPTGVEVEPNDEQSDSARLWNPDTIRVATKTFSIRHILDLIDDEDLELAPDFQRNLVWNQRQKSRLIESILLQIPLPVFYFSEETDGMMRVIDGLQRLFTIHHFVRGRDRSFALSHLEFLEPLEGMHFLEFPPAMQRRVLNAQIVAHVIDPTTPVGVKYDIFKRINTGGTPLNAQEIRHSMSENRSRDFLKRCTHTEEFNLATNGNLRDHIRMADREVVLRYCAFRLLGVDGYISAGSMETFLENATAMLDNPKQVPGDVLEELFVEFSSSMIKSYNIFGEHSFRKWPLDSNSRQPINRPLFESWSYVLRDFDHVDLSARKDLIVDAARNLMTYDRGYIDAITTGTGNIAKVRLRFERTELAARAGL